MPASYPGAIASFTTVSNNTPLTDVHPDRHNSEADEIVAIQTELGTTPSGSRASVAERLADVDVTQVACGDETTETTTGQKVAFRVVGAKDLVGVRASLTTAQASGSILTVDVHKNGVTVLSTLITIDNGEKTSTTAATPPVISVASFADDDEVTVHVTQAGAGSAGLKVSLLWG